MVENTVNIGSLDSISYSKFFIVFFSRNQLILQQQLTAPLPDTFYSGPFSKQSANAVSTELVQRPQQQLQLPQLQPPQLQLVNKSAQPLTKSTITIRPFHIICPY